MRSSYLTGNVGAGNLDDTCEFAKSGQQNFVKRRRTVIGDLSGAPLQMLPVILPLRRLHMEMANAKYLKKALVS